MVKYRERAQFWYHDVMKREIEAEAGAISKKKKDPEREKRGKSGTAPTVSNPHWEGHLPVRGPYCRGTPNPAS